MENEKRESLFKRNGFAVAVEYEKQDNAPRCLPENETQYEKRRRICGDAERYHMKKAIMAYPGLTTEEKEQMIEDIIDSMQ